MFWILAALLLFAAALVTFMPLLREKSLWQPVALAMLFLLPAGGLWIYTQVGTPSAIELHGMPHPAAQGADAADIESMLDSLRSRLTETPESLDGWILLARTLKTLQRYPEALEALEVAHRLAPDDPLVMVELAEARIFASTDGRFDELSLAMLERAVELDPAQQKGLWLLGIAAAQAGDDAFAISYWEALLGQLEAGSSVAQSVQAQINEAKVRMGMEVAAPAMAMNPAPEVSQPQALPPAHPPTGAREASNPAPPAGDSGWTGTEIRVGASEAAVAAIPPGAVLYVMVRSSGPAAGPPLGARRFSSPQFPLSLTITDADSMMAQRRISAESEIQLQARVSMTGSPAAQPGDWQSPPVTVPLNADGPVELTISEQVQ